MMSKPPGLDTMKVDTGNLYREEMFTDLGVATIRLLTPVKPDGSLDPSRERLFVAQANVMTPAGMLPVEAPIEAKSLQEAMEKFPDAVREAVERVVEELRELQREQASRIVVPNVGPGKIQLS
jgi:hypothetical protein